MNATQTKKILVSLGALLAILVNLSFSSHAQAQQTQAAVVHEPSPVAAAPSTGSDIQQSSAVSTDNGPFDWLNSRIPIHFTLGVTSYYDDNIYISPHKTSDVIFDISPGLSYAFGEEGDSENYVSLTYFPTIQEYYTNSQQDAVDQNAQFVYEHNFQKLKLSLSQGYNYSNNTSIQAGAIVVSSVYATKLAASYNYSDKVTINADFGQTLSYYNNAGYNNVYEWAGGAYFLYQITPKIAIGVGPRVGTDEIVNQPSQTWEQGLVHLTYNVTEKISIKASAGGEVRQFDTNGVSDQVTGVFDLGGYWTPFAGTSINLDTYRRNNPSYSVGGTNFTATGISAGVQQSFLRDFYLGLNGGYENDAYTAASVGVTGARNDNYYFVHPYVQWSPQKWVSVVAYYQYSQNASTLSVVSFDDNQVGATVSFKY
jgi:hypothetical protein